jgi:ectoine hydrolase
MRLVNWQRAVKSAPELDYMRMAGKKVEKIHARILGEGRARSSAKCDLVADIYDAGLRYDAVLDAGGDYPAIVPLVPSGSDAAAPHLTWDDQPMKAGEGTFFEVAGVHNRYHCPLSRTLYTSASRRRKFLDAEKAVSGGTRGWA